MCFRTFMTANTMCMVPSFRGVGKMSNDRRYDGLEVMKVRDLPIHAQGTSYQDLGIVSKYKNFCASKKIRTLYLLTQYALQTTKESISERRASHISQTHPHLIFLYTDRVFDISKPSHSVARYDTQ